MNIYIHNWLSQIHSFKNQIDDCSDIIKYGRLIAFNGLILEVIGLKAALGTICIIEYQHGKEILHTEGEVVGFSGEKIFIIPFQDIHDILPGARVFRKYSNYIQRWPLGFNLLGRVLDGRGIPLDQKPLTKTQYFDTLTGSMINPLQRKPITKVFDTGIRCINALLTIGVGQRMGLFSQSGTGKSILLSMLAKYAKVDIIVVGLIGERGREVKEFIENALGIDGLSRSVIVAAPADVSSIVKIHGAMYAMRIAEYFRDHNKDVLLILDSLTRYIIAQREIALSIGEIPVNKGYPPSIFSKLPNFIERAGNHNIHSGSITAFYTILTEEDDINDPISELAKSVLDGHIVLSKIYSESGHYPAIDISLSTSRVMMNIIDSNQYSKVKYFKQLVSTYHRCQDLINVGAYVSGTDAVLDHAIDIWPQIQKFLQQETWEMSVYKNSIDDLKKIV